MEEQVTEAKRWRDLCCEKSPAGSKTMGEYIKSDNALAPWSFLLCALGHHLLILPCKANQAFVRAKALSYTYDMFPRKDWAVSSLPEKTANISRRHHCFWLVVPCVKFALTI